LWKWDAKCCLTFGIQVSLTEYRKENPHYFGEKGLYAITTYLFMYIPEDAMDNIAIAVDARYIGSISIIITIVVCCCTVMNMLVVANHAWNI